MDTDMVNQFYWNGILITSAEAYYWSSIEMPYRGVAYGEPWPLRSNATEDENVKQLITATDSSMLHGAIDYTHYAPLVLNDLSLAKAYVSHCTSINLQVRVLLLASERSEPMLNEQQSEFLTPYAHFLGYDYASSSADYSALTDDFDPLPADDFSSWRDSLNRFGLFSDLETAHGYSEFRSQFVRESGESIIRVGDFQGRQTVLEDDIDFVCFGVYELTSAALIAVNVGT